MGQYNGVLTIKRNLNFFFCKKYARSLYRTQYNNANQIVNNYLKKHKDTGENTILFLYFSGAAFLLKCFVLKCQYYVLFNVHCFSKKIMSFKKRFTNSIFEIEFLLKKQKFHVLLHYFRTNSFFLINAQKIILTCKFK